MSTLRCASSVVGTTTQVEPISLGSLVLDVPCLSLHTSRILCSWSRRAVFAISSTFTTAADGVDMFSHVPVACGDSHVPVACGDPVKVWTTPRCTNKSSDVTPRSQNHCPQPLACGSHIGFASHVPDSPTPCENISTTLCALTYRILPQPCVKVCNMVALWQLRQIMAEKSARCDALPTCACLSSSGSSRGGQRPAKATAATSSIYHSHTSTRKHDRLRAVILNSARFQPSRGALIHRCVRVLVACFFIVIVWRWQVGRVFTWRCSLPQGCGALP